MSIEVAQSLIPATANTPLDARTRCATTAEMAGIENPFIGMHVYVTESGKEYRVTSLKAKQIGALTVPDAAVDQYELVPGADDIAPKFGEHAAARGLRLTPVSYDADIRTFKAKGPEAVIPAGTVLYLHTDNDGVALVVASATYTAPNPAVDDAGEPLPGVHAIILAAQTADAKYDDPSLITSATDASAWYAIAEIDWPSEPSFAAGAYTMAYGEYSDAFGSFTVAAGFASHAEGCYSIASGNAAHAEGIQTVASGMFSHAEGSNTIASGDSAHAQGTASEASGDTSFAGGNRCKATGLLSHADGTMSEANGKHSRAIGYRLINNAPGAILIGRDATLEAKAENEHAIAIAGGALNAPKIGLIHRVNKAVANPLYNPAKDTGNTGTDSDGERQYLPEQAFSTEYRGQLRATTSTVTINGAQTVALDADQFSRWMLAGSGTATLSLANWTDGCRGEIVIDTTTVTPVIPAAWDMSADITTTPGLFVLEIAMIGSKVFCGVKYPISANSGSGGFINVVISELPPENPAEGTIWIGGA